MDKYSFNRKVFTEEQKEYFIENANKRITDTDIEDMREVTNKALEYFKDMDDVECIYTYSYYSTDSDKVGYFIGVIVDDYWKFGNRILKDAGDLEITNSFFGVPGFIKLKYLDRDYSSFITEDNSFYFEIHTIDDFDVEKEDNLVNRKEMALCYTENLYYGDILYDKTGRFSELIKTYLEDKEEYNKTHTIKLTDFDKYELVPFKIDIDPQPTRGSR